jgi:hypothetical protein
VFYDFGPFASRLLIAPADFPLVQETASHGIKTPASIGRILLATSLSPASCKQDILIAKPRLTGNLQLLLEISYFIEVAAYCSATYKMQD